MHILFSWMHKITGFHKNIVTLITSVFFKSLSRCITFQRIASGERGGVVVEHRTPNREVLGPGA